MPKIGMAGASVLTAAWPEAINIAAQHHYQAFEIFGEFPQTDLDAITPQMVEHAAKTAEKAKMEICVHAPFTSLNLAAFNKGIREESVRQSLLAVDLCADLAGRVVIVHTGEYVGPRKDSSAGERKNNPGMKLQWDLNNESLRRICARAEQRGVTVCLENIGFEPEHLDQTVSDLLEIQKEVASPALKFCLDVGHARLSYGVKQAIDALGPDIRHIHFTDNMGKRDDHLVLGEGNSDYSDFIWFLREFPYVVTLEVVKIGNDPLPALKSREFFQNLLRG